MQLPFTIEVFEGDVAAFSADVLMLKYAPRSGGLDARIRKALKRAGQPDHKPEIGAHVLAKGIPEYPYAQLLIVGTPSIFTLSYPHLRSLGFDMLSALQAEGVPVTHVATTLHGVNTSVANDETEVFRAMLLGFSDAVHAGKYPASVTRVTVIERESHRADLMRAALRQFFPPEAQPTRRSEADDISFADRLPPAPEPVTVAPSSTFERPLADEHTPFVFVAMPFADTYDDHYYLALRPAITDNDYLCIRLDQDDNAFTGDIMTQVKQRIREAAFVVALLDGENPNVYLEVGYAWGVGTPTILVLHEDQPPPFDVQGARLLLYRQMYRLKEALQDEIDLLRRDESAR